MFYVKKDRGGDVGSVRDMVGIGGISWMGIREGVRVGCNWMLGGDDGFKGDLN